MNRDLGALTGRTFDVLVVGGGIYGLTIAYDAAQRGLSVALVERADFGSGASFNHLRTLHGGLRYLQKLDVARSRESIVERRALATIAPHTVRPLAFALPLDRSLTRGATAMRAAFLLDRLIAFDRNRGVLPTHQLPAGRVVSGDGHRRSPSGHGGGAAEAVWYDYVMSEADRLTFSFAMAAVVQGAVLANHLEASALTLDGRRVVGVRGLDRLGGGAVEVAARVTVNATGGGVDRLLDPIGGSSRIPMLKAMNLVTRRPVADAAIGGRSASGRHVFLVPWRGRALFGTWESTSPCTAEQTAITEHDVAAFLRELNQAFPSFDLSVGDVALVHHGVVPAVATARGFALAGQEQIRDHAESGERIEGLVSVVGAKYTTARGVAEGVTNQLLIKLQRPATPCRTATTLLPGGDITDLQQTLDEAAVEAGATITSDCIAHLVAAYGSRYTDILRLGDDRPELKLRLLDGSPVIGAELVWAARHEMVGTLADAVVRRTPLGALGDPGEVAAARAAELVGAEIGWSIDRRREEVSALRRFYALPT